MSRTDRQYRFRPPPELAAKLDEYCLRECRRSVNEALIVLVSDALERWRPTRLHKQTQCAIAPACVEPDGHSGPHILSA